MPAAVAILLDFGPSTSADEVIARDSVAEAAVVQTIDINAGVYSERAVVSTPVRIKLNAGLDTARYGDCLSHTHPSPVAPVAAWLTQDAACQAQARAAARLHIGAEPERQQRLAGGFDRATYDACRRNTLEVEATLPDAAATPAPR